MRHRRQHGNLHSGKKINNSNRFKFSLTNDVVAVGIVVGGGSTSASAVDVATGADVAANDDDAVGAVVPRQL